VTITKHKHGRFGNPRSRQDPADHRRQRLGSPSFNLKHQKRTLAEEPDQLHLQPTASSKSTSSANSKDGTKAETEIIPSLHAEGLSFKAKLS